MNVPHSQDHYPKDEQRIFSGFIKARERTKKNKKKKRTNE
jgi:hypothetical protein